MAPRKGSWKSLFGWFWFRFLKKKGSDGSGFWFGSVPGETVPTVPVSGSVPGQMVPTVPLSGSCPTVPEGHKHRVTTPEKPWKIPRTPAELCRDPAERPPQSPPRGKFPRRASRKTLKHYYCRQGNYV